MYSRSGIFTILSECAEPCAPIEFDRRGFRRGARDQCPERCSAMSSTLVPSNDSRCAATRRNRWPNLRPRCPPRPRSTSRRHPRFRSSPRRLRRHPAPSPPSHPRHQEVRSRRHRHPHRRQRHRGPHRGTTALRLHPPLPPTPPAAPLLGAPPPAVPALLTLLTGCSTSRTATSLAERGARCPRVGWRRRRRPAAEARAGTCTRRRRRRRRSKQRASDAAWEDSERSAEPRLPEVSVFT